MKKIILIFILILMIPVKVQAETEEEIMSSTEEKFNRYFKWSNTRKNQ